jgi:hypothetical protein
LAQTSSTNFLFPPHGQSSTSTPQTFLISSDQRTYLLFRLRSPALASAPRLRTGWRPPPRAHRAQGGRGNARHPLGALVRTCGDERCAKRRSRSTPCRGCRAVAPARPASSGTPPAPAPAPRSRRPAVA